MSTVTDGTEAAASSRANPVLRLALFAAFLFAMFYLVARSLVIDIEAFVRRSLGPVRWPPGLHRCRRSWPRSSSPDRCWRGCVDYSFGPLLKTAVTLCSAALAGDIAAFFRQAGGPGQRAGTGRRGVGRADRPRRSAAGSGDVVGQRFKPPGMSDALASYVFGAFGMPVSAMAMEPSSDRRRAHSSTPRWGRRSGILHSPLAFAAVEVWCVTAIIGAARAHRGYRSWRAGRR